MKDEVKDCEKTEFPVDPALVAGAVVWVLGWLGLMAYHTIKDTEAAFYRFTKATQDVSLDYARRVASSETIPFAGWGGTLARLAYGVVVPPGWKIRNDLDRWAERGVLVKAELRFPSPVPLWSGSTRSAYAYRLRHTESGPARCPVASFPDSISSRSLYGWSSLIFGGGRVSVEGMRIAAEPYDKAMDSDFPRLTLKRILASTPDARYLEGDPRCYLTSGARALRDAFDWTDFLFKEGLIPNVTMADGRPAILKRSPLRCLLRARDT